MHYIVARWTTVFCCWNAIIGFQSSLFVPLCNGWPSTMELIQNVMRRHQQQHHKHFLVHCSLLSHLHIVTYEYGVSICCPRWENIVIKLENPDMCVCVKKSQRRLSTSAVSWNCSLWQRPKDSVLTIWLDDSYYLFGWFSISVWMILTICLELDDSHYLFGWSDDQLEFSVCHKFWPGVEFLK